MGKIAKIVGVVLFLIVGGAFAVWDTIYEVRLHAMVLGVEEWRVWAVNGVALVIIIGGLIIYLIREEGSGK